jgi:hypothetical protein
MMLALRTQERLEEQREIGKNRVGEECFSSWKSEYISVT